MNQSSFIVGALLAGFVLYLAAKGRLTAYTNVLWGPTAAPVGSGGNGTGGMTASPSVLGQDDSNAGLAAGLPGIIPGL